ncbi:MAG: hypothetical protein ABR512_05870 [Desulfopila sp.]
MWIHVTNPMVTMPNLKRYRDGARKDGRFLVVSDVYPTPTTDVADFRAIMFTISCSRKLILLCLPFFLIGFGVLAMASKKSYIDKITSSQERFDNCSATHVRPVAKTGIQFAFLIAQGFLTIRITEEVPHENCTTGRYQ